MAKRKQMAFPPETFAFFRSFTIDGLIDRIEEQAAAELADCPKEDWGWPHKLPEKPARLKVAGLAVQRARLLRRHLAQISEGRSIEDLKLIRHALVLAIKVGASSRDLGIAADGDKRDAGKAQKTKDRHSRWLERACGMLKNNPRISRKEASELISKDELRDEGLMHDTRKPPSIAKVIAPLFRK